MAGDWIKVEHATLHKPEVAMVANLLGIERPQVVGLLVNFWIWFDQNSADGCVRMLSGKRPDSVQPMTAKSLDDVMHCVGFAASMQAVGWIEVDEEYGVLRIPNHDRHNGNPAKTRALDNKRKQEERSGQNPDRNRTREEKRREDKGQHLMSESPSATTDVLPLQVDKAKPSKLRAEAEDLLSFLNEKTARHYRPTDTTLRPLMARLKEGFSAAEVRAVIARKCREWKGGDMAPYLRPETLFNASKFAQYVGEVPPEVSNGA